MLIKLYTSSEAFTTFHDFYMALPRVASVYLQDPNAFETTNKPLLANISSELEKIKDHEHITTYRERMSACRLLYILTKNLIKVIFQFDEIDLAIRNQLTLAPEVSACANIRNDLNSNLLQLTSTFHLTSNKLLEDVSTISSRCQTRSPENPRLSPRSSSDLDSHC